MKNALVLLLCLVSILILLSGCGGDKANFHFIIQHCASSSLFFFIVAWLRAEENEQNR